MKELRISPELTLPLNAVTSTFAFLGQRGSGKSNCSVVFAEEMFAHGLPFVVVDPIGSWRGLRSSACGKKPGLAIPIFAAVDTGGDVGVEPNQGKWLAELIAEHRLTCIVDVSEFEPSVRLNFLADFAQRLYETNRRPLHVFLEECDDYIPQRLMKGTQRVVAAFENIVRRGRARGLGATFITQRSASINKGVLTQVETLFAMRTTGPHDQRAIAEWVKYNGARTDLLASLPHLKTGEAWCWSPSWLGVCKRFMAIRRRTFDTGATPSVYEEAKPAEVRAEVDTDFLQAAVNNKPCVVTLSLDDLVAQAARHKKETTAVRYLAKHNLLPSSGSGDRDVKPENERTWPVLLFIGLFILVSVAAM